MGISAMGENLMPDNSEQVQWQRGLSGGIGILVMGFSYLTFSLYIPDVAMSDPSSLLTYGGTAVLLIFGFALIFISLREKSIDMNIKETEKRVSAEVDAIKRSLAKSSFPSPTKGLKSDNSPSSHSKKTQEDKG